MVAFWGTSQFPWSCCLIAKICELPMKVIACISPIVKMESHEPCHWRSPVWIFLHCVLIPSFISFISFIFISFISLILFMFFGSFKNYKRSIEGKVDSGYNVWPLKDSFATFQSWWISYLGLRSGSLTRSHVRFRGVSPKKNLICWVVYQKCHCKSAIWEGICWTGTSGCVSPSKPPKCWVELSWDLLRCENTR